MASLISFIYNIGRSAFLHSDAYDVLRYSPLLIEEQEAIVESMLQHGCRNKKFAEGVKARRQKEAQMFLIYND